MAQLLNILIVDNDQEMARALADQARETGMECHIVADRLRNGGLSEIQTAFDGYEAEKIIREMKPDIVVSDINITGQSSQELLTNTRMTLGDDAPRLVFMTGLRPEEIPPLITKMGARVFHKPFDLNALLAEVRRGSADARPAVSPNS